MEGNSQAESNEKQPEKPRPKICGFWRRLFAFIIDVSILGIVGIAIGTLFYDSFAELGGWGRLFGFAVASLYFGLLNSSLGNGQTFGKRILKIQVVDRDSRTIAISKSFLRVMILGVPYFLNGALIPPDILINPFISLLLGLIVFFGCGAIVYLYVFNRETRQSFHDLVIGTYVINVGSEKELIAKPIWKGHLVVVSTLFVTVIVLIVFVIPKFAAKEPFSDLLTVQKNIQKSGLVHVATVTVGKSSGTNLTNEGGGKWESTFLAINAVLSHRPSDYDAVTTQIASIIFETYPKVMEKNSLVINASYGYDLGIASAWKSHRVQHSPQEWKDLVLKSDSK